MAKPDQQLRILVLPAATLWGCSILLQWWLNAGSPALSAIVTWWVAFQVAGTLAFVGAGRLTRWGRASEALQAVATVCVLGLVVPAYWLGVHLQVPDAFMGYVIGAIAAVVGTMNRFFNSGNGTNRLSLK